MKKAAQNDAAKAQHAVLGIEQERGQYKHTTHRDAQWFGTAGLGLFIHWGISSAHGGIDISWGMIANTPWDAGREGRNKITPADYFKLAERFFPNRYDPERWLAPAARAGFRYAVMTTRHHDGYAMWPSAHGDFGTRTHLGGRDLVRPYVEACRRSGLKVGLYYSPPDWYWNRNYMSFNFGSPANSGHLSDRPDFGLDHQPAIITPKPDGWDKRYQAYVRAQVIELLTRYAPVDLLWFDGGPAVMSIGEIRKFNPGIVVNTRMHGYGDFETPECAMPNGPIDGWWELCETWPKCSWGYEKPGGEIYRPLDWMLGRLQQIRRWGGNYLINVGPRPDGTLAEAYYLRMAELAAAGGFQQLDKKWRESIEPAGGGTALDRA
ncbi:MAG: alpha-L-fucosidase [Kiritimatiellae bacterium]|nr:alpha-L-fucosidase [Kiritimatiellia bacterium]